MLSGPVMPTVACAATAGAPASGDTSAAVATLPACLSALGPAVADTDSVCSAAVLQADTASSAAARLAESPQFELPGGPNPPSVAERLLQEDPTTSAAVSGLLLATKQLDPAATTALLQTEQQGHLSSLVSSLPLKPASTTSTAVVSSPVPALPSPKHTVLPAIPSAATADQQAAAEEAASVTHMAPPVNNQPSRAPVQQQHGNAPVHNQHEGMPAEQRQGAVPAQQQHHNGGRDQEGIGDLLYGHLAAVLATVPALRDRVLTFAPLQGQMHCPGIYRPSAALGCL